MPLLPPARVAAPFAALLAALAFACAGCGSGESRAVVGSTVQVAMSEFQLRPQQLTDVSPGRTTFVVRNAGTVVHRFELRSADGERRIALGQPLRPGESQRLTVSLRPGDYLMRCAQDRHNTLGEWGTIEVG